ncbi:signal peptide protein [Paenibacillus chitinolyticus]|uniref:Signal peptide protein n=1 Tax=Paenibacillus chitinolyticus TaxID=79263 RepID=A0A410WSW0_9BACL|nr:hypothetical protein [Paenibacillus chitinolyticus]MCY9588810.1 signal peptide protein [Paenibacillus chitinolyticus]MCY9595686.1 signal peptide protein [Paenibacillus chitinolyticus]QAV17443.1 signal peptide protein [Paenibacillus chitinolyticus]
MSRPAMNSRYGSGKKRSRVMIGIFSALALLLVFGLIGACSDKKNTSGGATASGGATTESSVVPWDYKVEQAKVGDLIGGDMTLLPNNDMLPNDGNFATGDQVWVLSFMTAEMKTGDDGKNDVKLSGWTPLKTFKTESAAKTDMSQLKTEIQTEVDLIGVYKTQYGDKHRDFAVVSMPSGHKVKQPISDERYTAIKDKKRVKIVLEEVHDFSNYDLAMSKFRGWAE